MEQTDSRIKEILGNLKRDRRELLDESASLFTGFLKRGLCSVRAAAERWKGFAHNLSDAVDTLFQPAFADDPGLPLLQPGSKGEPLVTVTKSMGGKFPAGMRMTLSDANEYVRQVDEQYRAQELTPVPVQVKIDYMKDGRADRYCLPLEIGAGGSLLEQLGRHLEAYRDSPEKVAQLFEQVPEQYRDALREELTPFVNDSIGRTGQEVCQYFQLHCDIAELEQKLEQRIEALPERARKPYQKAARNTIAGLRRAVNTGRERSRALAREEQAADRKKERPRASVKRQLRLIKASQPEQAGPVKKLAAPQR